MSTTWAIPSDWLARSNRTSTTGRPLCPACKGGYLHPYKVEMSLSADPQGWHGVNALVGWVAVCFGNKDEAEHSRRLYEEAGETPPEDDPLHEPCGFSMPMTPRVDLRRPALPLPVIPGKP